MSSSEDYQSQLAAIEAVPDDQVKAPNMPVDIFLQEVENTFKWVQTDKDKLMAAGLDWTLVESLPTRTGALREAESLWFKTRFSREEAEKEWLTKSPAAYELRDTLLHDYRFAYRNLPEIAKRVSAIAEGSGHADMIQDLNDLSVLGKANPEPLAAIGFDATLLDTAAATADEMAALLSEATVVRSDLNTERVIRDKAFTYVKQALDEIRNCGQYVFWHDEERVRGYSSQFLKNRRKKYGPKKESDSPVTQ